MFNIAGGALGHMTVLHASITEYVIVFGTPIGTEGYSGRFSSDDMLRGEARGYRVPDRCYALEYARGFTPSMLPFGLADSFTRTVDYKPVVKTMRIHARAVIGELLKGKI